MSSRPPQFQLMEMAKQKPALAFIARVSLQHPVLSFLVFTRFLGGRELPCIVSSVGKAEKADLVADQSTRDSRGMRPWEASTVVIQGLTDMVSNFRRLSKKTYLISHYFYLGCAKQVHSSQIGCLKVSREEDN